MRKDWDDEDLTAVLVTDRQHGKTTRLVEWLKEKPKSRVIFVHNHDQEVRLRKAHPEVADRIHSWRSPYRVSGLEFDEVGVDDAEHLIRRHLDLGSGHMLFVTMTGRLQRMERK